ncbi:hypothetical protein [Phycisphaera mikurensis]|uniref:Uncharacterized protein n=1 Tax=Phycisphaera mikurensis (strain NBRC 102666 / KCTC 22515 / FYK2301M01) TaxID=1142394 RepID=I0IIP5_PHYMF|nr:hypothetical protein [Phycisphaera mikurensis]MBB6442715.1 hypothetical protein [Phycisphaera mikurensis]BAM05133.1 hypothetical protein PSMK_29740 [Phycisphaera mikurensis NBRC 102666]
MSDAQVELGEETEGPSGWSWPARVFARGRLRELDVRLSFQDYDLWCRGRVPPARVAAACVAWLCGVEDPATLADPFDCARARRSHPAIDAELPERLGIRMSG